MQKNDLLKFDNSSLYVPWIMLFLMNFSTSSATLMFYPGDIMIKLVKFRIESDGIHLPPRS